MSELLRCQACGGAVVWDAATAGAACLFCGTVALELEIAGDEVPEPELSLPVRVSRAAADRAFRGWATRSWFRPKQLRDAEVGLHLMLLPAWSVQAELESHWAGLRRSPSNKSGKAPLAGLDQDVLATMVPASIGLTQAELSSLLPFDEACGRVWTGSVELEAGAADADAPSETIWEPPALTRRGARAQAHALLTEQHRRRIIAANGLLDVNVSAVMRERGVRLLMLPIYIGTFRYRDRPWRFLVNAQTGAVVGEAPLDWRKVVALALVVIVLALLVAWWRLA
jgi:hypothetical protein